MGSDKGNAVSQIMKYLKENMVIGKWNPGDRIPSENELCRMLGYSRISVRSAIQRYNEMGVLESRRGSGTFVVSVAPLLAEQNAYPDLAERSSITASMDTFRKWRQVRAIIEPEIAYRAAKDATPELIEKLDWINQKQFEAKGDQEEFIKWDVKFHLTLAEFWDNEVLNSVMQLLFSMKELLIFGNDEFGYFGGGYFHMHIAEAIKKHDAERARALMQEHQNEIIWFPTASAKDGDGK